MTIFDCLVIHLTSEEDTKYFYDWPVIRMLLKSRTGKGERGTGNGEPGTGVWELMYRGNPLENSKWRTKQKKRLEETIWVNASFYRLCPHMASAFL